MVELSKQLVAFKRNRILVSNSDNKINPVKDLNSKRSRLLLSLSDQLKVFGYFLGTDILTTITEQEIEEVYSSVIPWLVEKYHSGEEFKPLYPNFPKQVISLTDAELRFNQELVYRIGVDEFEKINPWYNKEEIEVQKSTHKYKELKVMTEEEFYKIPTQIMLSNNSLNLSSKQELEWFLINYSDKIEMPDKIPFKETLCIVMDNIPNYEARDINDILRYSFYIMGVDPSLPHVSKKTTVNIYSDRKIDNANWRKLDPIRRNKRREICNKIEKLLKEKGNIKSSIIDAKRFYGHWLLLSERLHPGDFAKEQSSLHLRRQRIHQRPGKGCRLLLHQRHRQPEQGDRGAGGRVPRERAGAKVRIHPGRVGPLEDQHARESGVRQETTGQDHFRELDQGNASQLPQRRADDGFRLLL